MQQKPQKKGKIMKQQVLNNITYSYKTREYDGALQTNVMQHVSNTRLSERAAKRLLSESNIDYVDLVGIECITLS